MQKNQIIKNPIIQTKNIFKTYKAHNGQYIHALKGVSLDIFSGEVLGLLGPNGAGKTTMASIIATLIPPTNGELLINNDSVFNNLASYRKVVGFCPQKPNLHPELTIEQNLFYGAMVYGLSKDKAMLRTELLMDRYALKKYRAYSIKDLSGGYKQRASIARALIHEPKIILFDEPTVGLDPHIRKELWNEIQNLRELGIAIIFTTHYLDEAELLSDKICILSQGQIKFMGTPEKLIRDSKKDSLQDVLTDLFSEE